MKIKLLQTYVEKKLETLGSLVVNLFRRLVSILSTKRFELLLSWGGWVLLLAVCVYIGTQASLVQRMVGDQFISTYILGDALRGAPMISNAHTNLIKLPFLLLQNSLGYSLFSYIALNVFFIFSSIALWIHLTGRAFGKEVRILSTFVFAAVLFASPIFAINITMTTLRHIEYPLGLLLVLTLSSLLIADRKNYLYKAAAAASLLALLVLNDIYFLYTLVPACMLAVAIYSKTNAVEARRVAYSLSAVLTGAAAGILLPKLLNKTGLISIIPGYLKNNTITSFDALQNSVSLSISQTLDLFGGFIFGQVISLGTLTMFMFLMVPIVAVAGIFGISKHYRNNKKSAVYFFHVALAAWLFFAYASYILSSTVNGGTTRFLTIVVYIGVTYFSWMVMHTFKNYRYLTVAACLVMVVAIPFSYLRVHATYKPMNDGLLVQVAAAKKIATTLRENNVQELIEPIGYSAINFHSSQPLDSVIVSDCDVPIPWANNAAWQNQGSYHRSAFLFEEIEYTPMKNGFCSEANIIQEYGSPEKIVEVPSINTTKRPAKLYIYNYDIRTKFTNNPE